MRWKEDESNFRVQTYRAPRGEKQRLDIKNCTSMKALYRKTSIFDDIALSRKHVPAPGKYTSEKHVTWTNRDVYTRAYRPKGQMSDTKKVTSTAEIALIKKPIPGPGKYKEHQNW